MGQTLHQILVIQQYKTDIFPGLRVLTEETDIKHIDLVFYR